MSEPQQQSRREIRAALIITFLMLITLVGVRAATGAAARNDFNSIYAAAWMTWHGDGARIYDFQEQSRTQVILFQRDEFLPLMHPPFETALFTLLGTVPYPAAYVVWGLINISLWFWFTHRIRAAGGTPRNEFRHLILCFGFFPLWVTVLQGQTSLLVLDLFLLAYFSMKQARDFRAGVFLGFTLLRFQLTFPFLLVCLVRRKWKLLSGFAVVGAALTLISILTVGIRGMATYLNVLIGSGAGQDPILRPWKLMTTLEALMTGILQGRIASLWIATVSVVASCLLITFAGRRWAWNDRFNGAANMELIFGATLAISIVSAFYSLGHDLSLMLLAILLVAGSPAFNTKSKWNTVLVVCAVLTYVLPFVILVGERGAMYILCPVLIVFALAALALARECRTYC